VRANKLYGVLCVGVFAPHAEFPENVRGADRSSKANELLPLLHLAVTTLYDERARARRVDADPACKSLDTALSRAFKSIRDNPVACRYN